ncbi:putative hemin storage protein [Pectobacterium parmentieri WPP163]|uniref:poly-beta-1,6-N-acetyl-D-glucosamine biosynthesis protein PgaD n=1 Tax=Pectobacterium parmentieri TaxID=1905730 RepID=UPI0001B0AEF8|nr:poly-beta-1,6-N-acetyl-D-glucosamine biosynthesis protein PgaD [Pectobacterium parmentieri]ACX90297.1 putative hemin storage protein [Pectobacterium parmentieri WPP163]AYH08008.1 poly-beta-1,6-N-acetyl-D-glucosamine biosynthesis protein PgaD [Pectobacterium parmentieri]AYH16760.1 poly-beta-1,6-N-acetyl-D-glucosamine biosynthesis protein PgaD [Pectobacterium parmentieri]AYH25458.1 poly-beta-1,6-N-acetyl-D-glucosamine biosynthesis protein PgaD [Pectobacterium parmentieri]MBN3179591.1 poly-bet
MHSPLIVSERRWWPRFIDYFLTLCGWGIFIWLFFEVFIDTFWNNYAPEGAFFTSECWVISIHLCIFLVTASLLVAWGKLEHYRYRSRKEQRTRADVLDIKHVARSFSLPYGVVQELHRNKIQRVWHNEHGAIIGIDNVSVATD